MNCIEQVTYYYREERKPELKDISLTIKPGEFLVIAGKSGCGKTTLSKCINGLIPHFEEGSLSGTIRLRGKDTKELTLSEIGRVVGCVFQDPRSQFFTTTVYDELLFGLRNRNLTKEEMTHFVGQTVSEMGIDTLLNRDLHTLSSGEKQKVAIACCCCMQPSILLLDEPSANLDPDAVVELEKLLKQEKEKGRTILVLEHRLYYLTKLLDRLLVMDNGEIHREYKREQLPNISEDEVIEMGLRTICHQPKICDLVQRKRIADKNRTLLLQLEHLSFHYGKNRRTPDVLHDINLTVQSGELLAIIGENGVGKTTLAKVLAGLQKEQAGCIRINGQLKNVRQRQSAIYYVLQDSDYQLFAESVEAELLMGHSKNPEKVVQMEQILEEFGLLGYRNIHPMALSRGQKQKVTIAAALMSDAKLLILDEPSSGLDGENMRKLAMILRKIAKRSKSILLISHDAEFIQECNARVVTLEGGNLHET